MDLQVKCRKCNAMVEYIDNNYYPRCDRCRGDMSLIENQIATLFFAPRNYSIDISDEEPSTNLWDVKSSVGAAFTSMIDIILDFNSAYENKRRSNAIQSNDGSNAIQSNDGSNAIEQLKRDGNVYKRDKFSCAICMVENDDTVSTWGECLHSFHTECMIKYHESTQDSAVSCPLCRYKVAKLC